jgi:hypothetical protein
MPGERQYGGMEVNESEEVRSLRNRRLEPPNPLTYFNRNHPLQRL